MLVLMGLIFELIICVAIYIIINFDFETKRPSHKTIHHKKSWEENPEFFYFIKLK